jgi:hypothetical protein
VRASRRHRVQFLKKCKDKLSAAKSEQNKWLSLWRKLNECFYPFLYAHLHGTTALSTRDPDKLTNPKMLDGEPSLALLVLAAGFMNGVTSPVRKWVNVKRPGSKPYEDADQGRSVAHSNTRMKILEVLAGSNYYESRAEQVYDGCGIGTGVILCYEDRDDVCTFTNCPPGSYSLITDNANNVVGFGREFKMKLTEILKEFGEDGLSKDMVSKAKAGGAQGRIEYLVCHLIDANENMPGGLNTNHPFREMFWLAAKPAEAKNCFLAKRPLYEWPVAVLRWACPDNSIYGVPPTISVMGKAVQLQNLEFKSDQGLDKMISPPMLVHPSMKNRPKAFQANGITYTSDLSAANGARPAYNVQVPFQELEMKRQKVVKGIRDGLYNYLFNMGAELETVRSATEINVREEQRLFMLGPVLHRSYNEDLSVIVKRVYGICLRKKLLEPMPEGEGAEIEFSSVLSDVQKASDVATIERFVAFTGQVVPAWPEVQPKINIFDIVKQYAEGLGIRPSSLNKDEEAQQVAAKGNEMQDLLQTSEVAKNFGSAGASLGKVDVGGGLSAVQSLLG